MERVRTIATFVAGILVGGSAVYFSPPAGSTASGGPSQMTGAQMGPPGDGMGPPDGQMGMPGQGEPGKMGEPGMGQPGMAQGQPGAPGSVGQPGVDPVTGKPFDPAGAPVPGAVPVAVQGAGTNAAAAPPADLPPADGAVGPPVAGAEAPAPGGLSTAPAGAPQTTGSRLEKHLGVAGSIWSSQASLAKASSKPDVRALATDLEAHAQSVPVVGEHMPPMQEVAGYLASSRVLLDRMQTAGMDVADLSLQIDMMMRPPKGKIPGGPRGGAAPE